MLLFGSQSFVFSLSKEVKIKINTVFPDVFRHKTLSLSLEQEQIEGAEENFWISRDAVV
jgi:hypothetical protein